MTLSSMVVSRDWQEVSVLECILGSLQMDVAVENVPERALARLNKSKIDALIVDCDLDGSAQFLRELQREHRHPNAAPLVIMGSRHRKKDLEATGALFAFQKPISVEQAVHTLSAARNMILDGRLRYHRQILAVAVSLSCGARKSVAANLLNLSQGGAAIRAPRTLAATGPVKVSFAQPGTKLSMKFQGEVAWTDKQGDAGIRFVEMESGMKRDLQLWLEQRYLTD